MCKYDKRKWPLCSPLHQVCTAGEEILRWVWEAPQQGKLQSWDVGLSESQCRVFQSCHGSAAPSPSCEQPGAVCIQPVELSPSRSDRHATSCETDRAQHPVS